MHQLKRLAKLNAHLVQSKTIKAVDYHVRADGKDSGNDGRTAQTAFLTTAKAVAQIPTQVNHQLKIQYGPGTFLPPEIPPKLYNERVIFIGDPNLVEIFAAEASDAGSTNFRIDKIGGGLAINAHRGQTIEFTSGDAIGSRRHIASNDATGFDVDRKLGQFFITRDPSPGDSYRVITCATVFEQDVERLQCVSGFGSTREGPAVPSTEVGVALIQIRWAFDGSAAFPTTQFDGCTVWMFGVEFDTSAVTLNDVVMNSALLFAGTDSVVLDVAQWPFDLGLDPSLASPEDWAGWGVAEISATSATAMTLKAADPKAALYAYVVMSAVINFSRGAFYTIMGRLYGRTAFTPDTILMAAGSFRTGTDAVGRLVVECATTASCVRASAEGSKGSVLLFGAVEINNTGGGRLLLAESGAEIYVEDFFGTPSGLTSGVVAVEARFGGKIRVTDTPTFDGVAPNTASWVTDGDTGDKTSVASLGDLLVSTNGDGSVIQKVLGPLA